MLCTVRAAAGPAAEGELQQPPHNVVGQRDDEQERAEEQGRQPPRDAGWHPQVSAGGSGAGADGRHVRSRRPVARRLEARGVRPLPTAAAAGAPWVDRRQHRGRRGAGRARRGRRGDAWPSIAAVGHDGDDQPLQCHANCVPQLADPAPWPVTVAVAVRWVPHRLAVSTFTGIRKAPRHARPIRCGARAGCRAHGPGCHACLRAAHSSRQPGQPVVHQQPGLRAVAAASGRHVTCHTSAVQAGGVVAQPPRGIASEGSAQDRECCAAQDVRRAASCCQPRPRGLETNVDARAV